MPDTIKAKVTLDLECARCHHPQSEVSFELPIHARVGTGEDPSVSMVGDVLVKLSHDTEISMTAECPACHNSVNFGRMQLVPVAAGG